MDKTFSASYDVGALEIVRIGVEGREPGAHAHLIRELLQHHVGVREVREETDGTSVAIIFDSRRTHAPDLHDALLEGGYIPAETVAS